MGGNHEVEALVGEGQALAVRQHRWAIVNQWLPMALTRLFIGIDQHIGARIRIAPRSDLEDQRRIRHGAVQATQGPGETTET